MPLILLRIFASVGGLISRNLVFPEVCRPLFHASRNIYLVVTGATTPSLADSDSQTATSSLRGKLFHVKCIFTCVHRFDEIFNRRIIDFTQLHTIHLTFELRKLNYEICNNECRIHEVYMYYLLTVATFGVHYCDPSLLPVGTPGTKVCDRHPFASRRHE